MTTLNGLQEKIFIDRYALKEDGKKAQIGDTVIALIDEGKHAHNQQKAVGEVTDINDGIASITLRDGSSISMSLDRISVARETGPEEMWGRLAYAISNVEEPEKRGEWYEKFYNVLDDWKLVPGGRIAAAAGTGDALTMFNCYVIPSPHDSRGGINETLRQMTEIMSRGGGVGINISSLRPKRATVLGVNGSSSGSVSWGGLFSYSTGLIEQGGSRRGALMLMLNDWHPDLYEFITIKQDGTKLTNANLSIAVSNAFMEAVKNGGDWTLRFPDTSFEKYDEEWDGNLKTWESKGYPVVPYKTVKARDLWDTIMESAHNSAEPGVVFMEYYNDISNSWYFNPIIATNPCAEQGLPAWGVCNLSSINLAKFVKEAVDAPKTLGALDDGVYEVDWNALRETIHVSVRFLDNVIDATPYHFEENRANQQNERRIGLGTMGLAEMLIRLGIRYGSDESIEFLDDLYRFIAIESYKASINLAEEKGAFPAFILEDYIYNDDALSETFAGNLLNELNNDGNVEYYEKFLYHGIRNVTALTQAPTGSTGTMVGTSTGIEPYFAFEYTRESRLGTDKQYVGLAKEWKDAHPGEDLPEYFVTAMSLSAEDHVKVQAVIQKWVDSSISKTVNAPSTFTVEDTKKIYETAFELGCKGVTIYRDGSRDVQVLSTDNKAEEKVDKPEAPTFTKRPKMLTGATIKHDTPFGKMYMTINHNEDGYIEETFPRVGKVGADIYGITEALGLVMTLALSPRLSTLKQDEKIDWLIEKFKGIKGDNPKGFGPNRVESLPDAIGKTLEYYVNSINGTDDKKPEDQALKLADNTDKATLNICPSCGNASLVKEEGCEHCINCGHSKCS